MTKIYNSQLKHSMQTSHAEQGKPSVLISTNLKRLFYVPKMLYKKHHHTTVLHFLTLRQQYRNNISLYIPHCNSSVEYWWVRQLQTLNHGVSKRVKKILRQVKEDKENVP